MTKMEIVGIDGLSYDEVQAEVDRGGVFVTYEYCISFIAVTFKRPSEVYFIRTGRSRLLRGLPLTFFSLLFGWWGFPFGPINTVACIVNNFRGGKDVTLDALATIRPPRQNVNPPLPVKRRMVVSNAGDEDTTST